MPRSDLDLGAKASAAPHRFTNLVRLKSVDSTNRYAAQAFSEGAGEGLVVVADEQLAGRGRRGRRWFAPAEGALLCSVLFCPEQAIEQFHLFPSLVGLATRDAVASTSGLIASLKWPNDLVVADAKLAGILAELVLDQARGERPGLVVGVGINLSWPKDWPPPDAPAEQRLLAKTATTIQAETGASIDKEVLLQALLQALERRYLALRASDGALLTMRDYRSACVTIGQAVRVSQLEEHFEGRALTVLDDGRLLVQRGQDTVALDTADVVHLTQLGSEELS